MHLSAVLISVLTLGFVGNACRVCACVCVCVNSIVIRLESHKNTSRLFFWFLKTSKQFYSVQSFAFKKILS